ncbi:MAG: hypothetical protein COA82_10775 [Alkaliphilus sp.]|nr:hypothetical protein [Alkaliphilus sp. AH-315-G20]MBN4074766.1 hypothetical protein [bacterium AH-315-E09]PHS30926.1 MAG: hypothetical protein COA82_10775 [Alkaliphilus sp.]
MYYKYNYKKVKDWAEKNSTRKNITYENYDPKADWKSTAYFSQDREIIEFCKRGYFIYFANIMSLIEDSSMEENAWNNLKVILDWESYFKPMLEEMEKKRM